MNQNQIDNIKRLLAEAKPMRMWVSEISGGNAYHASYAAAVLHCLTHGCTLVSHANPSQGTRAHLTRPVNPLFGGGSESCWIGWIDADAQEPTVEAIRAALAESEAR